MEPPLLDTSMLLEKPRNRLVSGGKISDYYQTSGMEDITWCDIHKGCAGPSWTYPCQAFSKLVGGCVEGAVCIATCGLCGTFMDDSHH
jgi:hypothetical protein